jgi:hypothetical protein
MRRNSYLVASVAVALFAACAAQAEDSNRNDVRANLEKDGWSVVYGKNFTEADWARGAMVTGQCFAVGNPGPFLAWFDTVLQENFAKIQSNLPNVARADLERWVFESLQKKSIITYKGLQIDAGIATYNRWQRIVVEVPDGIEYHGIHSRIKMKKVEKTTPLPNWHQFYVRYKLVPAN